MKHLLAFLVLLMMSPFVVAKSDKAAFNVWVEDSCFWFMGDDIVANADLHFVMVNHGMWTVSCSGEVVAGTLPEKTLVLNSPHKDDGLCCVADGALVSCTDKVHVTVTKKGHSTYICHGVLEQ